MSLRIVAISGSLRASSGSTALLMAAAQLAQVPPLDLNLHLYTDLGLLPHFNPDLDLEGMAPSEKVSELRYLIARADGVIFSTPEYAHGVPGSLKNALDWLVSSGEFVNKPVSLFNASTRSTFAQASLSETLFMMSARMISEASISLSLPGGKLPASEIAYHPAFSANIRSALDAFEKAIRASTKTS
jgi:chromate reductase, NAD(P)H dehydrogenase (quinone)